MKKYSGILKISLSLFVLGTCLNKINAQNAKDTTVAYLNKLIGSDKPQDKVILNDKLKELAASNKEADMRLAEQMYYQLNIPSKTDSLQKVELLKFPNGIAARNNAEKIVFDEKDASKAEKLYQAWVAKYPAANFSGDDHGYIIYDYASSYIAELFARDKNPSKVKQYSDSLKEDFWKGNAYGGISNAFYKNGDLANAELYERKAMESVEPFLNATDNAGKFSASGYNGICNTLSNIYYEERKYDEALALMDKIYKSQKADIGIDANYTYAKLYMYLNRNKEAFDKMNLILNTGKATPEMIETYKKLYVKTKGSDKGLVEELASIKKKTLEDLKQKLVKEMKDKPAPLFTLTDINGKKVSLQQFKGKTVVLDFWATWCGPCKKSFPAMQMAQNKYKKDPNVKFLFIHTWEKDDNAIAEAKAYVQSHHFDFEVLMDLKDPKTQINNVVSSYGVKGIPAKFVIDPKGNIRFQLTGFDGSNEAAVDEISMMIDMASSSS